MKSFLLALLLAAAAKDKPPTTYAIPLPAKPSFAPFEWLVGEWVGKTGGRGPQGEIHLSVAFALDNRFMIFRQESRLTASPSAPPALESWIGILSGGPNGSFLLDTYSSTGFVTRYGVTAEGSEIHLNSQGGSLPPPGWLFRGTIERAGEAEFNETVQMAPPNRPFFDYYSARFTRAPPAK